MTFKDACKVIQNHSFALADKLEELLKLLSFFD